MLLKVDNATKRFGGLVANDHLNIEIEKGSIVGLIGPIDNFQIHLRF